MIPGFMFREHPAFQVSDGVRDEGNAVGVRRPGLAGELVDIASGLRAEVSRQLELMASEDADRERPGGKQQRVRGVTGGSTPRATRRGSKLTWLIQAAANALCSAPWATPTTYTPFVKRRKRSTGWVGTGAPSKD